MNQNEKIYLPLYFDPLNGRTSIVGLMVMRMLCRMALQMQKAENSSDSQDLKSRDTSDFQEQADEKLEDQDKEER